MIHTLYKLWKDRTKPPARHDSTYCIAIGLLAAVLPARFKLRVTLLSFSARFEHYFPGSPPFPPFNSKRNSSET
jgi:hypothetical protein